MSGLPGSAPVLAEPRYANRVPNSGRDALPPLPLRRSGTAAGCCRIRHAVCGLWQTTKGKPSTVMCLADWRVVHAGLKACSALRPCLRPGLFGGGLPSASAPERTLAPRLAASSTLSAAFARRRSLAQHAWHWSQPVSGISAVGLATPAAGLVGRCARACHDQSAARSVRWRSRVAVDA